jgi:deazaflavin-dependent oxidoreductase (nitroreductase family)
MWYNGIIKWLIGSPMHFFVSSNMMLITFAGKKSGKSYTTPVNYFVAEDENGAYYATTSFAERKWWRNLRGGAAVTVHIKGHDLKAQADVFESQEQVAQGIVEFLRANPKYGKYFAVTVDENGEPDPEQAFDHADGKVLIKTRLEG